MIAPGELVSYPFVENWTNPPLLAAAIVRTPDYEPYLCRQCSVSARKTGGPVGRQNMCCLPWLTHD